MSDEAGRTQLQGRCHCGNLSFLFTSSHPPEELPIRSCCCAFCRSHAAQCTSDPNGKAVIGIRDPTLLSHYRFALQSADFLICRRCGVYLAAVLTVEGASYATVNTRAVADAPQRLPAARSVSYSGETPQQRTARRRARWTPAELMITGIETG